MAKKTAKLHSSTAESLQLFGERLRLARKRRRLTAKQVAELAGMAPMTLRSLERGGSGVTMGAYLSVMQVLGIERDIELLAKADPVGRELQDAELSPRRKRARPAIPAAAKSPETPAHANAHVLRPTRNPGDLQSFEVETAPPAEARDPPGENDLLAEKGLRENELHELNESPVDEHARKVRKAARGGRNASTERVPSAPDASPQEQLQMEFDLPPAEKVPPASDRRAQTTNRVEEGGLADSSGIANGGEPI